MQWFLSEARVHAFDDKGGEYENKHRKKTGGNF